MIDITPLNKYVINPCDERHITSFQRSYLAYGFDECFDRQINSFLNCEKTLNGRRIMQTNDHRYNVEMTFALWLIENAFKEDEEREPYYIALLERHNKNIEFETINGFEYDPNNKEKKTKTNKVRKNRNEGEQSVSNGAPKERKETAAERKLKAHIAKINALTFKPKTV